MNVVSIEAMQEIDKISIEEYSINSLMLMEYAGKNIFYQILNHHGDKLKTSSLNIFCGVGGNGGDGLVIARYAIEHNIKVNIYYFGDISSCHKDFLTNYNILKSMNIDMIFIDENNIEAIFEDIQMSLDRHSIIVDAMFGTGFNRKLAGVAKTIIERLNNIEAYKVSVDIPSALPYLLNDDDATFFETNATLTVGLPKDIFFKSPISRHIGNLNVVDSIFPKELLNKPNNIKLISDKLLKDIKLDEDSFASKREQGMISIVAGSEHYLGAAIVSALTAYRLSLGYVRLYVVGSIYDKISIAILPKAPEIVIIPIGDKDTKYFDVEHIDIVKDINKGSSCVFGCGIGRDDATKKFVDAFLSQIDVPTIVDADALYIANQQTIEAMDSNFVLTPHIYEYAKITGEKPIDILSEPYASLYKFREISNASIILKDAVSFALSPNNNAIDNIYINYNPKYGMGKAGVGDMFASIIGSMLAKGLSTKDSIIIAFYIQKYAFEYSSDIGKTNQPSDMLEQVAFAYNKTIKLIKDLQHASS